MWLHGKPEIRRLHPEGLADALHLRSHASLALESEQVLDYRIAEGDVEAAIVKLGKIRCIPDRRLDVLMPLFFRQEIQDHDLDIATCRPTAIFPERVGAPNIKNAQGPGQGRGQCFKQAEPLRAELIGK